MEAFCPYCGTEVDAERAQPGEAPGTVACPGCNQEIDLPPGAAPQAGASTETLPPSGAALDPGDPDSPLPIAPEAEEERPLRGAPGGYDPPPWTPPPLEGRDPDPGWAGSAPPPPGSPPPPPSCDGLAGLAEEPPRDGVVLGPESIAWEGPGGLWGRLGRSILQVLLHPATVFAAPFRRGMVWPTSFGLIMGTLGSIAGIAWQVGLGGWASSRGAAIFFMALSPLMVLVSLHISAAITTFGLMMVGGNRQGYRATFRVMGYSQAISLISLIPMWPGALLTGVWTLIVLIGGLAAAHGIGRWRAIFGMLLPLIIIFIVVMAIIAALGLGAALMMLKQKAPFLGGLG